MTGPHDRLCRILRRDRFFLRTRRCEPAFGRTAPNSYGKVAPYVVCLRGNLIRGIPADVRLMGGDNHDTLVYRLAQILVKLNQGEKLNRHSLATEFGVILRTIRRDLNERFADLPLQKVEGHYRLDRQTCSCSPRH